jgi:hypothetical protein
MMFIDARLPLRFGLIEDRSPDEAVLTDALIGTTPGHMIGCLCCAPRNGAALALAVLFRERATGQRPLFRGVLAAVGPAGEAAIRAALRDDPVASGRFRLA